MSVLKLLAGAIASVSLVAVAHSATVDQAISKATQANEEGQVAQKAINEIDNEIRAMEREYADIVAQSEGLSIYLQQLQKQVNFQREQLAKIDGSIQAAKDIDRDIEPLMVNMVQQLAQFIQSDLPFYTQSRLANVTDLEKMLEDAELTVAEKYRRILKAYQEEVDYGSTLEKYRDTLEEKNIDVDFLRVGRLTLVYLTLDQKEMGVWDQNANAWVAVDEVKRNDIIKAMRIASEQAAPALVKVPVVVPE
ncbi:MAG: DUF3450 domain-containing protein [Pseudomonadota bacterium]|nr:DUF3450 domain-containing protein [Pseudomonadota bacterium]